MDPLPALTGIHRPTTVGDRNGGRRGDPEAFRRALQQQAGEQPDANATPDGDAPVRPGLQRRRANGRKDDGTTCHHVDVVA